MSSIRMFAIDTKVFPGQGNQFLVDLQFECFASNGASTFNDLALEFFTEGAYDLDGLLTGHVDSSCSSVRRVNFNR